MVTLKEAISLDESSLNKIRDELKELVSKSELNSYIGDLEGYANSGVPILIKDNISVEGVELNCASKILKDYISPYSATVIKNMEKSKLVPFGRANMDEFAMGSTGKNSSFGIVHNPTNMSVVSGGSSSGSAAAVAGGIAIASLGSDTGGSVRMPAAYCGCVGFKPSYGMVSRYGVAAYGSSLEQVGTLTQNVTDSAILFDAIKGDDPHDDTTVDLDIGNIYSNLDSSKKYTIAILDGFSNYCDKTISDEVLKLKDRLASDGHNIITVPFMDYDELTTAYYIIVSAEAATNLGRYDGIRYGLTVEGDDLDDMYIKTRSQGFNDIVKKKILLGNSILSSGFYDSYYKKALSIRQKVISKYSEIFTKTDLILSPVTPTTAFNLDKKLDTIEEFKSDYFNIGVNLAKLPAISIPISRDSNGLNIGIQLIGDRFKDQDVFNCALAIEELIKK